MISILAFGADKMQEEQGQQKTPRHQKGEEEGEHEKNGKEKLAASADNAADQRK